MSLGSFATIRDALGERCQSQTCCNMPAHLALDRVERRVAIRDRWLRWAIRRAQHWLECLDHSERASNRYAEALANARARIHSDICSNECAPECRAITEALGDGSC